MLGSQNELKLTQVKNVSDIKNDPQQSFKNIPSQYGQHTSFVQSTVLKYLITVGVVCSIHTKRKKLLICVCAHQSYGVTLD